METFSHILLLLETLWPETFWPETFRVDTFYTIKILVNDNKRKTIVRALTSCCSESTPRLELKLLLRSTDSGLRGVVAWDVVSDLSLL